MHNIFKKIFLLYKSLKKINIHKNNYNVDKDDNKEKIIEVEKDCLQLSFNIL